MSVAQGSSSGATTLAPRGWIRYLPLTYVTLGLAFVTLSLGLLLRTAADATAFARLQPVLLGLNGIGILVLLGLIGRKAWRLALDYRRHVPGSRMMLRAVGTFAVLAVAPLLVVYWLSLQFLNRGIDSWFDVNVRQGFEDALTLSRSSLSLRMGDFLARTEGAARELSGESEVGIVIRLDTIRRANGAEEMTVIGANRRLVAFSSSAGAGALPKLPGEDVMLQARQARPFVSLDPTGDGGYGVFTAAPLPGRAPGEEPLVLVGQYAIPDRLARLAEGVQGASAQYGRLTYQRPYLKGTFALTLTMVLLLSLLAAVYGALFWAQRLVQPVQDLIAGTRAVAKGDYETRLSLPSRDEIGYLVTSFNEMTKRLARARAETELSRAAVEKERANLATVLARLSTGVIAFEPDLRIRSMNAAAGSILGVDPEDVAGLELDEAARRSGWLGQFLEWVGERLHAGQAEWREQLPLHDEGSRRELMCACTALPAVGETPGGYVVVFDDITTLLQAQKDAAWGEVARRLAHEIKNPLTPIQLSAERMRRKFLGSMNERDAQVLERATHTIVQQVEAMKGMVNAFSEYARAPQLVLEPFDLNALVGEVADLYRAADRPVRLELSLDAGLGPIEADRGRLRQILSNLVKNALEALEGTPEARVRVSTLAGELHGQPVVHLEVTDNGPGFQKELMGQVFDPYVTSKPKGTGLGLAIVKKIVEEHGGRIEAHNVAEGGAQVLVTLPLNDRARADLGVRETRKGESRRERA